MRETEASVFVVAKPYFEWESVGQYLKQEFGEEGLAWLERAESTDVSDGELLVEAMGRLCYRSWAPGLNANVTKVREDSREYIENIVKVGHGSVLEHASYSFVFANVSRVFTHELVRHRAGVAISQESLRYVRLTDLGFRIPVILEPHRDEIIHLVERLEDFQRTAAEAFGLDDDGVPFHYKKEVTSALRRLAPIGLSTSIGWTANLRTLRHVIDLRTAPGAEEEIRIVFSEVARIMKTECPAVFADFEPVEHESGVPHWKPAYRA